MDGRDIRDVSGKTKKGHTNGMQRDVSRWITQPGRRPLYTHQMCSRRLKESWFGICMGTKQLTPRNTQSTGPVGADIPLDSAKVDGHGEVRDAITLLGFTRDMGFPSFCWFRTYGIRFSGERPEGLLQRFGGLHHPDLLLHPDLPLQQIWVVGHAEVSPTAATTVYGGLGPRRRCFEFILSFSHRRELFRVHALADSPCLSDVSYATADEGTILIGWYYQCSCSGNTALSIRLSRGHTLEGLQFRVWTSWRGVCWKNAIDLIKEYY
jgi:hypothetical protein